VAEILDVSDFAHKFSADRSEFFSPHISIVSSASGELGKNGPENSDESTTQGKPCGRQPFSYLSRLMTSPGAGYAHRPRFQKAADA
jgi:hypothetical protein